MRSKYTRYIEGPQWAEKRAAIMDRAGGVCEKCTTRKAKQVHHLTYRNLFDEPPEDLQAVCIPCHQAHHPDKKISTDPGGHKYIGDLDCSECTSVVAEFFVSEGMVWTFCVHCGASTKMRQKSRRPRVHGVPCPDCGKLLASEYSVGQHQADVHH